MRKTHVVLSIAAMALALATGRSALGADDKVGSAYDRLPDHKLIKQLSSMGMIELLNAMDSEIPPGDKSLKALALRAQIRIGLADALGSPEDRARVLDEAIPVLRQVVRQGEKEAKTDAEKLEAFRNKLELAVVMGITRIDQPHVLRLQYLQGSEQDRKIIDLFTKDAVGFVDELREDIADTLRTWRPDMEKLILVVPQLEDLEQTVKYKAGWIRLHRAMALEDGAEKQRLCREIIADMRDFTRNEETGVKYWALCVTGIAYRMLKQHDKGGEFFDSSAAPEANPPAVRLRAWFERARNRIEEGDYAKAEKNIDEFEKSAQNAMRGSEVMVDLRVVLLRNYLYEIQAIAEKDPKKAQEFHRKAEEALFSFIETYADRPELVKAFLDIIATKFSDVKDIKTASPVVLLARGFAKVDSTDPKDMAEAEEMLKVLLVHPDMKVPSVAKTLRPAALTQIAFLMNRQKRNLEAARYFVAMARLHPAHRTAFTAARYAVISLNGVLAERTAKGQLITTNLRLEFIRALQTLLDGWGKEQGIPKWNFDLAGQCMRVSETAGSPVAKFYWQCRAIAAFEKVPSDLLEYLEAANSALDLRTRIALDRDELTERFKPGNAETQAQLAKLAEQLLELDRIDVSAVGADVGAPGPTTAPAAAPPDQVTKRTEGLAKEIAGWLKTYSDPQSLIANLKTYVNEAAKEAAKVAQQAAEATDEADKAQKQAVAEGIREWAANADYLASVLKYEELPKGKKPDERKRLETEALDELHQLPKKWAGTATVRSAWEFEIRKRVEQGQTDEAIRMIASFKQQYPEQADKLIKLVVYQVRQRIVRLKRKSDDAEQLRRYQLAYVGFARELYGALEGLPLSMTPVDKFLRDLAAAEKKGDASAVRAMVGQYDKLLADCKVAKTDIKAMKDLTAVVEDYDKAAATDRAKLLTDLGGVLQNVCNGLRDVVQERYALTQMYGDALLEKGDADKAQQRPADGKAAFELSRKLFQKCRDADEDRRKLSQEWIEKELQPRIAAIEPRAKGMDDVKAMIEEFKEALKARGLDPAQCDDLTTLEFSYSFLSKAPNRAEELKRLPRTTGLLVRAWENLLSRTKTRVSVDPANVIGLARSLRGLGSFTEALEFFRQYVVGINRTEYPREYWEGQLERCSCRAEAGRNSRQALDSLLLLIRQLELQDREMGGLVGEFRKLKFEVERRMQELPQQPAKPPGGS